MAKTLTDEDIKLNLIINGNQAQKELGTLEKETRKYTEANKQLTLEKKRLEQQGQKDSARYKQLTAEIKANNVAITTNKEKMKQLQNQIGITGLTMKQLTDKANLLKLSLRNSVPGGEAFNRYNAELKQVNARLDELRLKAQTTRMSLGSIADGFNRYQTLAVSFIATLTGIVFSVQKIIDIAGKLSDAQADVMKTTGMTKVEVDELTKSFGAFKTRTARIELLQLAEEAGRLGIEGVDNVKAFVEQANKMKVALGDDLSDEAIREVGKMVNVYKVGDQTGRDFAGSMDALGSSINKVSSSGSNQAGFLVDYLKRQAGIAAQAKLSAADNIGYAATFDEIGQSVEVSATAMNKVWMDMFQNPSQFAKIAGMSIKDFNQLLATDSNEAMLKFLEGLQGNDAGLQVMLESMKDLEVGGARGVQALAALANNTELLRKRQVTSNQALMESTSLTDEYDVKNNNLQATLEKLQKTIIGIFSSEGFVNWLESVVNWLAELVGATDANDTSASKWKVALIATAKVLAIVAAALITNVAWQKLATIWTTRSTQATFLYNIAEKARAFVTGITTIATQAQALAVAIATRNTIAQKEATQALSLAMKTTPWGFVLSALAAIIVAYSVFKKETSATVETQKMLSDISLETSRSIAKEKAELSLLSKVAADETLSKEKRLEAVKRLNEIIPDYIGNITLENIKNKEGIAILQKYTEEIYKNARARAVKNTYDKLVEKQVEIEQKTYADYNKDRNFFTGSGNVPEGLSSDEDIKQWATEFTKKLKDKDGKLLVEGSELFIRYRDLHYKNMKSRLDGLIEDKNQELETINAQIKALEPEVLKDVVNTTKTNTDEVVIPGIPTNEDEAKKAEEARKKRLEELRKSAEERLKLERELEDAILANMDESYQKEWQLEQTNWTRKIEDLQARLVKESEIELALKDANNSKLGAEQQKFRAQLAKQWQAQNKHIYGLIETAEQTHQLKLKAIREKAGQQLIEKEKQAFDDAQIQREINHNLELAQLGTDEDAKKRLKEQYEKESIEAQEEFLNKQLGQLQAMLDGASIGGIDFSLLSPEAKEKLERDIKAVELAMARLKAAKNGETNQDSTFGDAFKSAFGDSDVLGFTTEQWEQTYRSLDTLEGKLKMTNMVVTGLQNLWAQYNSFVEAKENAQLRNYERNTDRKKHSLKRQLDTGLISQTQYNRAVETMDAQLDKKKAELEYEQAKRQKRIAIFSAIIGTAQAVINAANTQPFFPLGLAMMALAGIMGGLQIATISKQPLPARGYEEGLYPEYTKREQDGKLFRTGRPQPMRSGLYKKSTILVGEGPGDNPEMVIDKKTWPKISPAVQEALLREIRGVKGFEKGYYDKAGVMQVPAEPTTPTTSNPDNVGMMMMAEALNRNSAILEKIDRDGILAKVLANDYKSMENLKEGLEKYNELKSKSRR